MEKKQLYKCNICDNQRDRLYLQYHVTFPCNDAFTFKKLDWDFSTLKDNQIKFACLTCYQNNIIQLDFVQKEIQRNSDKFMLEYTLPAVLQEKVDHKYSWMQEFYQVAQEFTNIFQSNMKSLSNLYDKQDMIQVKIFYKNLHDKMSDYVRNEINQSKLAQNNINEMRQKLFDQYVMLIQNGLISTEDCSKFFNLQVDNLKLQQKQDLLKQINRLEIPLDEPQNQIDQQ